MTMTTKSIESMTMPGRKPHTTRFLQKRVASAPLRDVHQAMSDCLKTAGYNPQGMMLVGPSGVGKSIIVQEFEKLYPAYDEVDRTVRPVVYAVLRGKVNVNGMLTILLNALGDPMPSKGQVVDKILRLCRQIEVCGVQMVIIDEIQQTLPEHTTARAQEAADVIKGLIDETKIPFVLVGVNDSVRLLQAQRTGDPTRDQLRRRFKETYALVPPPLESKAWKKLVIAFQRAMDVPCINLTSDEMLARIYLATLGLTARLSNLLEQALELSDGETQINLGLLVQAHQRANSVYDISVNPFEVSINRVHRLLAEPGLAVR